MRADPWCADSRRAALGALAACALALAAGCAGLPQVKPWDKGDLARPAMNFDEYRFEAKTLDHVYFSKEAASGGSGVGGGGCGCN